VLTTALFDAASGKDQFSAKTRKGVGAIWCEWYESSTREVQRQGGVMERKSRGPESAVDLIKFKNRVWDENQPHRHRGLRCRGMVGPGDLCSAL
jgi:hypothetical protein